MVFDLVVKGYDRIEKMIVGLDLKVLCLELEDSLEYLLDIPYFKSRTCLITFP